MDQITGEIRTVSVTTKTETREEQQKVQVLSDSSQFGGEHEETVVLYLPSAPDFSKLKHKIIRVPVTIYAKAGVIHRNYWDGASVGIEIKNDKGDFVSLVIRPDSLRKAQGAS